MTPVHRRQESGWATQGPWQVETHPWTLLSGSCPLGRPQYLLPARVPLLRWDFAAPSVGDADLSTSRGGAGPNFL